ncbi:hypothetical protein SAMN05880558_1174 [Aeromonas sp. RU39B]|uniref:hypothetical protein n=1 Tax=Aeromonas sp. RU39B TaxID=1907416 RepID=UPI000956F75C|nr:hypothetical protein SAMN05880558_1174 [Aeromonas sp. RU39B]
MPITLLIPDDYQRIATTLPFLQQDPAHPLLALPNVLCTPHLGYAEQRSYELYFHSAFANVQRFLAGDCSMVLNPAALG